METNGSWAFNPEINVCTWQINSSASPEIVFTTTKDVEKLNVELFQKILSSTILFTIINCVGVPGNLFVFLVYLRKFKTSATRVFVMTMAMSDFLVNLSALPVRLVYYRHMYTISCPAFCTIVYLVMRIPLVVSYLVLVCASLDRRRRVCQPLRPQLDARQAIFILILIFIMTAIATFPFVSFFTGIKFTTTTGINVRKCGFQREFPGDFVKLAEGIVLAVYCVVGLALIVGSYGHILYRVKQQSKRLSQNLTSDGGQEETSLSVKSSPISGRRLEEEVQNTTEDCVESRDEERCVDQTEGGARELMLEDPSVSGSYPLPARRRMTVGVHQSRNLLASKTTLVMFVLTITTVVCLTPYIIWTGLPETVYEPNTKAWVMNLSITGIYLPTLRSTITPFIYFYFNPLFRSHCRQILNF
ncbi:putative neuropeptide Y receptor 11 isoform X2 [Pomacea canaliculata]|uniref:putative neuropeptide Y receptor 11 isoform X2 n=1 Tax=Pomacea canaliculata TaxID=400727 RepID=UPI000D73895A|nr:putative neuropeptide Y receptor 11 isoform X2 [Pomacea canaliculata]